jgi:hypothetical protein
MGLNSTGATNSDHWNWIKFYISIPLWAKPIQLHNPIDFSPIQGNQTGPKGLFYEHAWEIIIVRETFVQNKLH